VGGAMPVAGASSHSDASVDPVGGDAEAPLPIKTFVYVSGYDPQISVLSLDTDTATLASLSTTNAASGAEPTFLAFSPNKQFAYAIDEQLNGPVAQVIAFTVDQTTGALSEINRQDTGATIGAHVAVHPSGQWVLAANYGDGSVSVFAVRDDGGLQPPSTPVAAGAQAHQVVFDAAGSVAFVPCVMAEHVAVFDFSAGALTPRAPATIAVAGGPRTLAFTPDQRFAYVLTQNDSTIAAFGYAAQSTTLTFIETVPATPNGGSFSAHLVVHESGKFLYASNRMDNGIALFAIDPQTGQLNEVAQHREMLNFPRLFAIDPAGDLMLIGNQHDNSVVMRRIDPETGQLAVVGNPVTVPPEPTFVGVLSIP
jgi:6-phosphogluconolactonase